MASKYAGNTDNKFTKLSNELLGTYNAWDIWHTGALYEPLRQQLAETRQLEFYDREVTPTLRAVANMQRRGLLRDQTALTALRRRVRAEIREVVAFLEHVTGNAEFNPNSPAQIAKLLYTQLGLRPPKRTAVKGTPSVDKESLVGLLRNLRKRDEPARPLILALMHYSKISTIDERYLGLEADSSGVVRPQVKTAKVKTLRFAYQNPPMQQFPAECRHVIVARPGCVLLAVDYSQLEARLQAYLSNDRPSIRVLEAGGDLHAANAADLFEGTTLTTVTPEQRYYAKSFLYRITYGSQGSDKEKVFCICDQWGCAAQAPPILELTRASKLAAEGRWFARHPAVERFQRGLLRQIRQHHYYDHPITSRRYFLTQWGSEVEREIKNEVNQRGAALLMNRAMVALDREFQARILLQMHDEFILEVAEQDLVMWATIVMEVMERPVAELGGVKFPTEAKWGYNWGPQTATNPDGLRKLDW